MSRERLFWWALLLLTLMTNALIHQRDQVTIKKCVTLLREGLVIVDSLQARNACLESAGVDCTEPRTVGGDKLPYGRRP